MQPLRGAPAPYRRWKGAGPPLWVLTFTLLVASSASTRAGGSQSPEQVPALAGAPLQEYRGVRRMHAQNDRLHQEGWLEAWTELDSRGFRYGIVREGGSDQVRNRVLKSMLLREQELIAAGQTRRADLSPANYEFGESSTGDGERYVVLKPRRKDMLLVHGRMVLSPDGSELLRVEGRLARNPSFWTSAVTIVREFARLDGVQVPISTRTFAKLRLAGVSRMTVSYEYESINGRAVSLSARRTAAAVADR